MHFTVKMLLVMTLVSGSLIIENEEGGGVFLFLELGLLKKIRLMLILGYVCVSQG